MGRVLRAYRHHPFHGPRPLPQGTLAGWLGLTQTQLSRAETGPQITDLAKLTGWARTLAVPADMLWFKLPPSPQDPEPATVPDSDGSDLAAMRAFRAADRRVGGGHLYAAVIDYLRAELAPRLLDGTSSGGVFPAAAALTEMAGWMAHDSGRDVTARRHLTRAAALARSTRDPQLTAHISASLRHLDSHTGNPAGAIQHAHTGRQALGHNPTQPGLTARLLAMQARGHAALGQAGECDRLLADAAECLTRTPDAPASPWGVSVFDNGSLASEATHCMTALSRPSAAQHHAEHVITARAPGTRSHAFGKLALAAALLAQDHPLEAAEIAGDVVGNIGGLGSFLVIRQLAELRARFTRHRDQPAIAALLARIETVIDDSGGFYRWLTHGEDQNGQIQHRGGPR
jgi:hypothetical protein